MMKFTLALLSTFCVSLMLISCETWPYRPQPFVAPKVPPPPNAFVSKDSLYAFTGPQTNDVKFAYTKTPTGASQTIYFVDFNDSAITPRELKKPSDKQDWDAWCPIISPSGTLVTYYLALGNHAVAYCQELDSAAEPVLISDPGSDPHFYKTGLDLYVTYADTTGMLTGDHTAITANHTYRQKIDSTGQKIGSPEVIATYPFYGGLSRDGKYICTGYANAYIYNFSTLNFFAIDPTQQTCNPSMTPDSISTGQMMFLNIGGHEKLNSMPAADTGKVGEHKFIFIADTNNNYINGFNLSEMLPAYSSGEWQCPKWSNSADFFCALAASSTTGSSVVYDCYLISISTRKMLLLNTKPNLLQFESSSKPYVFIGGN
jgi:hypothetical protein